MVTARTVAMAANRLLDADLDAQNPRTARRAIAFGSLSSPVRRAILAICCLGFIAATAGISNFSITIPGRWCCRIPVLVYLCGLSVYEAIHAICHYYLGIALAWRRSVPGSQSPAGSIGRRW